MVRFSCFQANVLSHKQKKTVQLSSEAMQKTLEDDSKNRTSKSYSDAEAKPFKEEGGDTFNGNADHSTDSSPTERDCRSEEIGSRYSNDCDDHIVPLIKKSKSLGSRLNWKDRTSGDVGSEEETEQKNSYDGSSDCRRKIVPDGSLSNQFQETLHSGSVQAHYDFAKNESTFSVEDPLASEKEFADKDDNQLPGEDDCGDCTPYSPTVIVRSSSLPNMGSGNKPFASCLPYSRSDEDLKALGSRKTGIIMHEDKRKVQDQEKPSFFNNDKTNDENRADGTYEAYSYVGSAKDWIIPTSDGANMDKSMKGTTSFHYLDEVPPKDFKLKRIEDWVMDLQHFSPLKESNESAPFDDQELPKSNDLLEGPTTTKLEVKVNPGMEAAKRYISSLNASATAAQLTNLGLVVIPFLSTFVSLKALNLSGNAITRITAGSLPRGLHILNLSKNYISTIEGLRDLTRLRVLDLSYNRILRIGHGLSGCSSIKELYLAGNKISEVEGLHRLLKLNVLDLRFNKISTTKSLGQLAANYSCLQALSLEGNPAQKNVGDEQLKKFVQNLLPNLTYYNRQSIKVGTMKDTADRSTRLGIGAHQIDRGLRLDVKNTRKGTHGIVAQKVSSSSVHGRKSQVVAMQKPSRSRRLPPSGIKTATHGQPQITDFKLLSLSNDFNNMRRARSEGTLGGL